MSQVLAGESEPPYLVQVRVVRIFPNDPVAFSVENKNDGQFRWQLALQVEDMTGRVDVLVNGEEGTHFLGLSACDLNANHESLKVVRLSVSLMRTEGYWLDCLLSPLIPEKNIFYLLDTRMLH